MHAIDVPKLVEIYNVDLKTSNRSFSVEFEFGLVAIFLHPPDQSHTQRLVVIILQSLVPTSGCKKTATSPNSNLTEKTYL